MMMMSMALKSCWQINHEPDLSLIKRDFETGTVEITTDKLCKNVTQAKNTLTQRMRFPGCVGEVTVDASLLKDGDYAGLCALQGCYGLVAVTKKNGKLFAVMKNRPADNASLQGMEKDTQAGILQEEVEIHTDHVKFRVEAEFVGLDCSYTLQRKLEAVRDFLNLYTDNTCRMENKRYTGMNF